MARTENKCGECTLCCTAADIPELQKPVGVRCRHLESDGCGIYVHRPGSCRGYRCLWLKSGKFSHTLRPDQCGVIFDPVHGEKTIIATAADPKRPDAWQSGPAAELIQRYRDIGFTVFVVGREKHALLAEGRNFVDDWNGIVRSVRRLRVIA